jgi:hypothetical protein
MENLLIAIGVLVFLWGMHLDSPVLVVAGVVITLGSIFFAARWR